MAETKFTPQQESAINTTDKTLLISAAAGSGKTATLTERIIRSLTRKEEPEDISRMLIVTFTNAAVGELRDRIKRAIEEELKNNPGNESLERQLKLLPMAKICTIDSFCNEILRKNSDKVGIPPNYRIADAAEVEILSYSILSGLIDALYENERCDIMRAEEISELADTLTSSKKNSELEEIFLKLYEKSKSSVHGVGIFKILADKYKALNPKENEYTSYAVALLHSAAEHYEKVLFKIGEELTHSGTDGEIIYGEFICKEAEILKTLVCENDYFSLKNALDTLVFERLPAVKKENKTPLMEELASLRTSMKSDFKSISDKYFFYTEKEFTELFRELHRVLTLFSKLISEFDEIYMQEKIKRLVLEYSDIERFAYTSLYEKDGTLTDFAESQKSEYSSVYIDEYQDVNALQAKIFDAISRCDNRFMVGDIKQSIYGFRSAEPDIFAYMKKSFPKLEDKSASPSSSIFMSKNFRSDEGIIDFVNSVFDKAFGLTKESIGYLPEDRLEFGKIYKNGTIPEYKKSTFILVPSSSHDGSKADEANTKTSRERECKIVAEKIEALLKNGKLNSKEATRPSDIAIILRGNRQRMNDYSEALSALNIPSEKADDKNFFLNSEVLLVLCLLNSIDNPEKDIYLAGLLASPLFRFTADELFLVRNNRISSLYKSLVSYTEENPNFEKGRDFIEKLEFYRTLAEGLSVDALILRLYNDTGLLNIAKRFNSEENLLLLYDYAKKFSCSSLKGLYNFIKFINNIIERGTQFDAKRDGDEKDAVHIMTVHASKGLEYPIVFYVDTDTALSDREKGDKLAFSEKFGLSLRLRSPSGLALVENPIHNTVVHFNSKRYLEEELRVIYVALTRAKEELFIVGKVPEDYEDYLEKLKFKKRFLDKYSIYKTKSALELILVAGENYKILIESKESEEALKENASENILNGEDYDSYALSEEELFSRLSFNYSNDHLTKIPEKLSVSALTPTVLDGSEEEEISLLIESSTPRDKKRGIIPDFIRGSKSDESTKRGIATHNYLQFFSIENLDRNGAEEELERLFNLGFISKEDKERVRLTEIELFRKSDFFREMKSAQKIYRELRFNTRLPAKFFTCHEELRLKLKDSELLVQGVIDCIIEDENGNLHLADYKTDRLSKDEIKDKGLAEKKLNDSHARQLSYYSLAVEKIFGKAPKTVRVYSLPLGSTVNIKLLDFYNK